MGISNKPDRMKIYMVILAYIILTPLSCARRLSTMVLSVVLKVSNVDWRAESDVTCDILHFLNQHCMYSKRISAKGFKLVQTHF